MTNTNPNTHTVGLVISPADVRTQTVVEVIKGAITPLVGGDPVLVASSATKSATGKRMIGLTFEIIAATDQEATRTAQVMRSAILPLVTGATVSGCYPID